MDCVRVGELRGVAVKRIYVPLGHDQPWYDGPSIHGRDPGYEPLYDLKLNLELP